MVYREDNQTKRTLNESKVPHRKRPQQQSRCILGISNECDGQVLLTIEVRGQIGIYLHDVLRKRTTTGPSPPRPMPPRVVRSVGTLSGEAPSRGVAKVSQLACG